MLHSGADGAGISSPALLGAASGNDLVPSALPD